MPLPFDATLKELVQVYAADWLAMLDQPRSEPIEILTPDLSTLTAFTDIVFRTNDSLLHLDFQSGPDPSLGLPPFYVPGAVRVGLTVTDVSSTRHSATESGRGHISPNSAGVRYPSEL